MGHTRDRGKDHRRRWQAIAQLPTGQRVTQSFEKKLDADRWWQEQEQKVRAGTYVDPRAGKLLLSVLAEMVLTEREPGLQNQTRDKRRSLWRNQLEPFLGDQPIGLIQHATVRAWVATATEKTVTVSWHTEDTTSTTLAKATAATDDGAKAHWQSIAADIRRWLERGELPTPTPALRPPPGDPVGDEPYPAF